MVECCSPTSFEWNEYVRSAGPATGATAHQLRPSRRCSTVNVPYNPPFSVNNNCKKVSLLEDGVYNQHAVPVKCHGSKTRPTSVHTGTSRNLLRTMPSKTTCGTFRSLGRRRSATDIQILSRPYKPRSASQMAPREVSMSEAVAGADHDVSPVCYYCSSSLIDQAKCVHPLWPDNIMCGSCSVSMSRCFVCERKAVAFCSDDGNIHTPIKCGNASISVCGSCVSLGVVESDEDTGRCKELAVAFLRQVLGIEFTPHMLEYQSLAKPRIKPRGDKPIERVVEDRRGETLSECMCKSTLDEIKVSVATLDSLNEGGCVGAAKFGQCDMRRLKRGTHTMRVVDEILIAKGLPFTLFTANLCHELLHAYIFLSGFPDLDASVEEGVCNAVAVMYMNYRIELIEESLNDSKVQGCGVPIDPNDLLKATTRTPLLQELRLCDFTIKKFYRNEHPHYGEGFRRAIRSVYANGLLETLRWLRTCSVLPCPL